MRNNKFENIKYVDILNLDYIYRVYLSDLKIYECVEEYSDVITNDRVNDKLIGFRLVKNKQLIINVYKYILSSMGDDLKYLTVHML